MPSDDDKKRIRIVEAADDDVRNSARCSNHAARPSASWGPTSCSWLNAVEGFFAKLTRRRLKNGVFHSVVDLQAAINRFIKEHNEEPKPFIWKADPDDIIAAVRRGHQMLESNHSIDTKTSRMVGITCVEVDRAVQDADVPTGCTGVYPHGFGIFRSILECSTCGHSRGREQVTD